MFEKLKSLFQSKPKEDKKNDLPEISWIPAEKNQWNIPVLDVRPVTQTMLSTSTNVECANNAISFGQDDGTGFAKQNPKAPRKIPANLSYRIDRVLAAGALFIPRVMEHKWAVYYHDGRILCIRSWTRELLVAASVECVNGIARLTSIQGAFTTEAEDDHFTIRTMDYLLRSHALGLPFPAPLPAGFDNSPKNAAMWCMNTFGNMAFCATHYPLNAEIPDKPLRTHSLLHIAIARGDIKAVEGFLKEGLPIDLLAGDGLALLHWAFAREDLKMAEFLIQRGSPIDVRSAEGATPLMTAVQSKNIEEIKFLLKHGADVNAVDLRGFSSLHRTAEIGNLEFTKLLLDHGARADLVAQELTPISLAEKRGHDAIVSLLKSKTK